MMELRPIQAALLAGRAASRRTTANPSPLSYSLAPSFYRCFSSTRPSLSEAEATAPPTPSMQEWSRQQEERQQQQQQQQQSQQSAQPQRPAWGSPAATNSPGAAPAGLASLLRPAAPSPQQPSTTAPSPDPRRNPWASPQSSTIRRAQEKRLASADPDSSRKMPGILDELGLVTMSPTGEDFRADLEAANNESAADVKYRLRPSIGRTVHIDTRRNVDLARGLGMLNLRVRVNKVSQDVNRQRFHERPGLKRKRLRRERWRARFKEGFKATCQRVQELARQGW